MRDVQPKLQELAVACLGISPDEQVAQRKFAEKLGLGFPLLSDREHRIASDYGVWGENKIIRSAFLIDDGRIVHAWYRITPDKTVPELMKVLRAGGTP